METPHVLTLDQLEALIREKAGAVDSAERRRDEAQTRLEQAQKEVDSARAEMMGARAQFRRRMESIPGFAWPFGP